MKSDRPDEVVDLDIPDVEMDPLSGLKPFLLSTIPIIVLFFIKFSSRHIQDGLIILGLLLTAMKLNSAVVRQVQLKRKLSKFKAIRISVICVGTVVFLSNVLDEPTSMKRIFTFQSIVNSMDGMSAVWSVLYADGIVKLLSVGLKALIVALSPTPLSFFKRGCLLSIAELVSSAVRAFIPGMQLCPYIFSNADSIVSLYLNYFVFAVFIVFKLYQTITHLRKLVFPISMMRRQPDIGTRVNVNQAQCDFSQKNLTGEAIELRNSNGKQYYLEEDFYHWMATYGVCPETGYKLCPLVGGNGHTSMKIILY